MGTIMLLSEFKVHYFFKYCIECISVQIKACIKMFDFFSPENTRIILPIRARLIRG